MQSRLTPVRFGRAAGRTQGGSPHRKHRTDPLKSNRQWSQVSWPVSILVFAVPLVLALFTFLMPKLSASPEVAVRVTDRYTGQQISGATLTLNQGAVSTGPDGTARIELPNDSSAVTVEAPGYEAITTTLSRGGSPEWEVALRPNVLRGRLVDEETSAGIAAATVVIDRARQHGAGDRHRSQRGDTCSNLYQRTQLFDSRRPTMGSPRSLWAREPRSISQCARHSSLALSLLRLARRLSGLASPPRMAAPRPSREPMGHFV